MVGLALLSIFLCVGLSAALAMPSTWTAGPFAPASTSASASAAADPHIVQPVVQPTFVHHRHDRFEDDDDGD